MEGLVQPLSITITLDDSIAICIPTSTRQIVIKSCGHIQYEYHEHALELMVIIHKQNFQVLE
jgi:hypothetical protein